MTFTLLGALVAFSKVLNSIGLFLDIWGAFLLFKFGLPEEIRRSGANALVLEQVDVAEAAKAKRYDRRGKFGLGLLLVGFVLQLLSNFF
jgi:hypothetical protein